MVKSKFQKLKVSLPESPGIYQFHKQGRIIYIGKAINLKNRLDSYFNLNLAPKTALMVHEADKITYIKVRSELEALLLEAKLIKLHQPKYNFISKDDKHALYIHITQDKYPIVKQVRKSQEKGLYFGPFPSSNKVTNVLKYLRRNFPYADHKLGKKACLYHQIGLCDPCPNLIEKTKDLKQKRDLRKQYLGTIFIIIKILNGQIDLVLKKLSKEMKKLSRLERYEEALLIRNQIANLEYIIQKPIPENAFLSNPNLTDDLIKEELKSLKNILEEKWRLKIKSLYQIECYDVSHLSGYLATGSMVTFIKGESEKSLYRRFKVKRSKNSDVEVMTEIAQRREKHLEEWGVPDLIFVDGGWPQAEVFKGIFSLYHIPVLPITKGREKQDFPETPALNLVTRIRDESHRFAKKYHNLLFRNNLIRI